MCLSIKQKILSKELGPTLGETLNACMCYKTFLAITSTKNKMQAKPGYLILVLFYCTPLHGRMPRVKPGTFKSNLFLSAQKKKKSSNKIFSIDQGPVKLKLSNILPTVQS